MKRRERKHKYFKNYTNWFKKINIFKYLSIFLIVLFVISIPTVIKKLIKINKIECKSQYGDCNQVLGNRLQVTGNYRDIKKIIEQRLGQDVQISSYLIQYKIPSTIKIDLVLKKPKYAIKNLSNAFYLIDKEGLILTVSSESNLPFLVNDVIYTAGQNISNKDLFSLKLLEKVNLVNSATFAEIKKETLEITISNGILVKFPLDGDVDVLVGSLSLIFSRLNEDTQGIRMENVTEIDLRFKNPVLR